MSKDQLVTLSTVWYCRHVAARHLRQYRTATVAALAAMMCNAAHKGEFVGGVEGVLP